jgi:hypothetical protein
MTLEVSEGNEIQSGIQNGGGAVGRDERRAGGFGTTAALYWLLWTRDDKNMERSIEP